MLTRSRIDKLNLLLKDLDDRGLTTNEIENIKNALENMNADIGKRGRQDRFSKSKKQYDNPVLENLGNKLKAEYKRINTMLKSDDRMKQDDLTDQDYLDFKDTETDYITHSMQKHGLSSTQIQDIYNIVKDKGLKKKDYERVIRREIDKQLKKGFASVGYRTVVNPDDLSNMIKKSFDRFKARR